MKLNKKKVFVLLILMVVVFCIFYFKNTEHSPMLFGGGKFSGAGAGGNW